MTDIGDASARHTRHLFTSMKRDTVLGARKCHQCYQMEATVGARRIFTRSNDPPLSLSGANGFSFFPLSHFCYVAKMSTENLGKVAKMSQLVVGGPPPDGGHKALYVEQELVPVGVL